MNEKKERIETVRLRCALLILLWIHVAVVGAIAFRLFRLHDENKREICTEGYMDGIRA